MKTFFRPEMNTEENSSFSPSAGKPKQFIKYLTEHNIPLDIKEDFAPLSREDITLAHNETMVNGILDLNINNGFGNKSAEVAKSLPFTSGSFYAAAEYALKNSVNTFSPTSGFHHAGFNSPEGFCTFNGLLISALKLKQQNQHLKVGIVDCDQHYGNGTEEIIKHLKLSWIKHYTFGYEGIRISNSEKWLLNFEQMLLEFSNIDILFFQAGADPHIDDPLGGTLTSEQMRTRDEILFVNFHKLGIPVVWNLAGGYQKPLEKVLELHRTTYEIATLATNWK